MAFLEILVAMVLGVHSGIITGLVPGIHVNLISVLMLSFSSVLLGFVEPAVLGVFIISLAITHSFLDSLPGIYLGAPDAGTELNVLPGHRLLQQGLGHNAVVYTVLGSLGSLVVCVLLLPVFIASMAVIFPVVRGMIGYILIAIMVFMIVKDRGKWLRSLVVFLFAGVLGLVVFNIPQLSQPLFPLLSGLFGFSILLVSLFESSVIPKQDFSKPLAISKKNVGKTVSAASSMGFIAAFLPGFGSSQAAIMATMVVGDVGDEGFLTLVGGINTANMLISIGTAYVLDKARNGAIVAVKELIGSVQLQELLLFVFVALIVGGVATVLAVRISKIFAKVVVKVKYSSIVFVIIGFIILLTAYFDGLVGLLVLITATAVGLLASAWTVGKNHLMGCLILPVILYFVL